jgi:hypothetical protein
MTCCFCNPRRPALHLLDFWRPAPKFCPRFAVSLALVSFALLAGHVPADEPRALDPRLVLERIAAEPEIVTPTGW